MATATLLLVALTLTSASPRDHPLTLMYIANEGVLVATGPHRILIDALFDAPNSEYAAPAPDLLDRLIGGEAPFHDVELLLVTHNHPDHFRVSVVDRFLLGHSQTVLIAPVDVVQALRDSANHWTAYQGRVRPLDLGVGERATQQYSGGHVTALRTLHSGARESPMNLMYLVETDGWIVFHEGDPDSDAEVFRGVEENGKPIDLALVHYWYPFNPIGRRILDEFLMPRHVALMHLPVSQSLISAEMFAGLDDRFTLLARPGQELELRPGEVR